jgi:hypothetical protein
VCLAPYGGRQGIHQVGNSAHEEHCRHFRNAGFRPFLPRAVNPEPVEESDIEEEEEIVVEEEEEPAIENENEWTQDIFPADTDQELIESEDDQDPVVENEDESIEDTMQEDIETEDALSDVAVESDYPLDEGVALGPTGRSYDSSDDAASDRSDEESVVEEVAPIRYASNPKSRDTQRGQAKAPTHTLKRAERNLRSPATYLVNPHKTPLHFRFTPVHTPCSNEKSRVTKHFRTGSQRNGRLSKVRY